MLQIYSFFIIHHGLHPDCGAIWWRAKAWTKSLNKIPFGPVLELWWWRAGRSRAAAIFGAIMIQLRPGSSSSSLCWVAAVIRGDSTNRNTGGHIRRNIQVTTKPGADDRLASEISIVDMVILTLLGSRCCSVSMIVSDSRVCSMHGWPASSPPCQVRQRIKIIINWLLSVLISEGSHQHQHQPPAAN